MKRLEDNRHEGGVDSVYLFGPYKSKQPVDPARTLWNLVEEKVLSFQEAGVTCWSDKDGWWVQVNFYDGRALAKEKSSKLEAAVSRAATTPKDLADPRTMKLSELRSKRKAGKTLTAAEQQELLDVLLGV